MPTTPASFRRRDPRPSRSQRGYDRAWQRLRLRVLRDEPLCRFCKAEGKVTPAEHVDHIQPVADAPHLRLVPSNLRPLCASCHNRRTRTCQLQRSTEQFRGKGAENLGAFAHGNRPLPFRIFVQDF